MTDIEENLKIIRLIDIYGVLLTQKQLDIVKDYYFDNLSLTEIGENLGISRQAVNDTITKSIKSLKQFEDILKFSSKINTLEKDISSLLSSIDDEFLKEKLIQIVKKMRE